MIGVTCDSGVHSRHSVSAQLPGSSYTLHPVRVSLVLLHAYVSSIRAMLRVMCRLRSLVLGLECSQLKRSHNL